MSAGQGGGWNHAHSLRPTPVKWIPPNASNAERARQPEPDTDGGKPDALSNDEPEYIASARAECDAHAHLVGPLRHRKGEHTVDTNGGKK